MATTGTSQMTSWRGFKPATLPDVPPWTEKLGRAGYIAKGVVYFIIGLLAFKLAIGAGGQIAGAREAIREIGQQPYGRLLLGLIAIGLLGYTAWRWVQAGKDTEGAGDDAKGIVKRIGFVISGFIYLALGCFAGSLALGFGGLGGSGGGGGAGSFLFTETWGRVLLGLIGAIVAGLGLYLGYKGYRAKFMEKYDLISMSETFRRAAYHAGRTGLITRGIAFVIVGGFMLSSAVQGGGGKVSGIEDALAAVAAQPYGKFLLGAAGFGLMCYAVHCVLMGFYRRFNVKSS